MDYLPLAVGSETSSQILNCYEGRSSGLNSIKKPKQEQILSSFGRDSLELSKFGGGVDKPVTKMQIYQTTLDKIIERMPKYKNTELIVIDTQGYELEVLKGASELLKTISLMELEVTRKVEVGYYENCPSQSDCIDYLTNFGLFPDHNHSHLWGPAGHGRMLFRRNN